MTTDAVLYLRGAGTSMVIDCRGDRLPRVLHWGADLGDLNQTDLEAVALVMVAQQPTGTLDDPVPVSMLPEQSAGWLGIPGVAAHRKGRDFSTSFVVRRVEVSGEGTGEGAGGGSGPATLRVEAEDRDAAVSLVIELELLPSGLFRQRATLSNEGSGGITVDGLLLTLPVPSRARELLDMTGRHLRERSPQRHAFTQGTHVRESRNGRTGLDASLVMVAGEPGFGFERGEVWGVHVAWSGNQRLVAEAVPSGVRLLGGGETLLAGEVHLTPAESYETPWVYASYGDGLDAFSARFHDYLRARPRHPSTPRPVTLNTWEAVYFDHDLDRLSELADLGARVGVERFVLDDGWFPGRDNDRSGLGDWFVDPKAWPDGLHPLVDRVVGHGMQFGLWVEPEMVSLDSDLARTHPEWVLGAGSRMPPFGRYQQVLDLANPLAYDYLLTRLDALLTEYPISYLKWDHNRDLVDAGSRESGRPSARAQTLAVYRLMDELRARHPHLEIESCASGGGRIDLGVLERTDRVWASDCIDPLERQQIQRWTGLLVPPEMMGSHVGAPTSHTTGRTHSLDFRAGTAVLCHFGIEWDLSTASESDLDRLTAWISTHKRLRDLLRTGRVVRGDHHDPALWVSGVVAPDRSRAVYALAQVATGVQSPPGPVRLPGLDPAGVYRLCPLAPGDLIVGPGLTPLPWWTGEVLATGSVLTRNGVQAPLQYPERIVLVEAVRQ